MRISQHDASEERRKMIQHSHAAAEKRLALRRRLIALP